jgi:hypothetical protein
MLPVCARLVVQTATVARIIVVFFIMFLFFGGLGVFRLFRVL